MIACFGEIMLRLSPEPDSQLIEQASCFKTSPGGSESNVAIVLSGLGHKTKFLTAVSNDVFGRKICRYLQWHGVDTSEIVHCSKGRTGLYFTEKGSGIRGYRVFYDREHSAYNFLETCPAQGDKWLKNCSWLHLSGIALATSRQAADFAVALVKKAKLKSIPVSFDINHRKLLWNWCNSASERCKYIAQVTQNASILLGNETDFQIGLFGNEKTDQDSVIKKLSAIASKGSLSWVAVSQRHVQSADINTFGGILYDFKKNASKPQQISKEPKTVTGIIDRIGTGDAFSAGIIDGFLKNFSQEKTLERAVALGIYKHSISGDACIIDNETLENCLRKDGVRICR